MKNVKCMFVVAISLLIMGCETTAPIGFVNIYETETSSLVNKEVVSIISEANAKFKVYSLSNERIAIVIPNSYTTTNIVDLNDLNNAIIINNQQRIELAIALRELASLYRQEYTNGVGTLYDYYIYEKVPEREVSRVLLRLQLRIEDLGEKSKTPFRGILLKMLNYSCSISINDIEELERTIK